MSSHVWSIDIEAPRVLTPDEEKALKKALNWNADHLCAGNLIYVNYDAYMNEVEDFCKTIVETLAGFGISVTGKTEDGDDPNHDVYVLEDGRLTCLNAAEYAIRQATDEQLLEELDRRGIELKRIA